MPSDIQTQLTLARLLGQRRPRRRLPRQVMPHLIELEYQRSLRALVLEVRRAYREVFTELPGLLELNERERRDVSAVDRIRQLLGIFRRRAERIRSPGLAENIAARTVLHNRGQFAKQVRAGLGVDIVIRERGLPALMQGFVAENVALIKDIPEQIAIDVEKIITRGVGSGKLHGDIAGDIEKRWATGNSRAALIARDQVGKFYGQTNAMRQRAIGVESFRWRTVGDDRVRDEHAGLDGLVFRYDDPPSIGLPGEPILCRCYAEPVFDALLGDL